MDAKSKKELPISDWIVLIEIKTYPNRYTQIGILTDKRYNNGIKVVITSPGSYIRSDHNFVVGKLY